MVLETSPQISVAKNTQDYFAQIFVKFLLEKNCFEYWKIKNDQVEFQGWPDAIKMDHWMEQCWTKKYDHELTFLYR